MEPSQNIDPQLRESSLDYHEQQLRIEFVNLYMQTRDPVRACIELGFLEPYARDWARQFMSEGFVLRLITLASNKEDSEEHATARRNRYRAWLEREANFTGKGSSHNARVSAITNLMKIEGMDAPIKTELEIQHRGGVMMVPALTDPDSWGQTALESQTALKSNVKD